MIMICNISWLRQMTLNVHSSFSFNFVRLSPTIIWALGIKLLYEKYAATKKAYQVGENLEVGKRGANRK